MEQASVRVGQKTFYPQIFFKVSPVSFRAFYHNSYCVLWRLAGPYVQFCMFYEPRLSHATISHRPYFIFTVNPGFFQAILQYGADLICPGLCSQASWYRAAHFCRFNGMDLATIESQEEHDKLTKLIQDYGYGTL